MILQDAGRDKGGWSVAEGPRHQLAVSFWIRVLVGLFGLMLSSSGSEGGCEWITINLQSPNLDSPVPRSSSVFQVPVSSSGELQFQFPFYGDAGN